MKMNPSVTIFLKIMADRTFAAPQKNGRKRKINKINNLVVQAL